MKSTQWRQRTLWAVWLVGTLCLAAYLGCAMQRVDKADAFLPGQTSYGHYQIEMKCTVCHTPMHGVKQEACLNCYKTELEAANDAHPPKKFSTHATLTALPLLMRACVSPAIASTFRR